MSARLERAAANFAAAQSGNAEHYLYEQTAILIEEEMRERPGLTQRDVAAETGINLHQVNRLLKELSRGRETGTPFRIDWGSGANTRKEKDARALERADPDKLIERLAEAVEQAPPLERKRLVKAIVDPSTAGGRHIANEVIERELEEKRARAEKPTEPLTGVPLPALWASMCVTIDKWRRELSRFTEEDLDELGDDGAEKVAQVVEGLEVETQRWLSRLRPSRPNLRIIEQS